MSSIPAAKERPSGIDAAKEAVLAYATRLGNRSLYARQSVAILAELSRLEEEVATLTRERDEAREALKPFAWIGQWLFARDLPDDTPMVTVQGLGKPFDLTRGMFKAAHTARQSKEGGE